MYFYNFLFLKSATLKSSKKHLKNQFEIFSNKIFKKNSLNTITKQTL